MAMIWDRGPAILNQHIFKVVPEKGTDKGFLLHLLNYLMNDLSAETHGSTMKHIRRPYLNSFPVVIPIRENEQRTIASILDTIDDAIRHSEALIAKLKMVRAGLLHNLLTYGLDENGELRDPVAHPEQFKESELGLIPKEWEISIADDVCHEIVVGIVIRPTQYYTDEGIPILRSFNITEYGIDPRNLVFMSEKSNEKLSKSRVSEGNVVTVRTGEPGTSSVIPPEFEQANCVDVIISRLNSNKMMPYYYTMWLNSERGREQILRLQGGLAQQHFNVGELQRLHIAVPGIDEQKSIAEIYTSFVERIAIEDRALNKLQLLKRGLMDDLLTGRVRILNIIGEDA